MAETKKTENATQKPANRVRPRNFKCGRCGTGFSQSRDLQRHQDRKTSCIPILDLDDLPEEKRKDPICRFCGRAFSTSGSLLRHIKQSCKIAPRNGDTSGMDKLYEHVVKKQEERHQKEMKEMREEMESLRTEVKAMKEGEFAETEIEEKTPAVGPTAAHRGVGIGINNGVNLIDQSKKINKTINKTTININIFGSENTSHITQRDVLGLIRKLHPIGEALDKASERLILSMAMMIYSDERKTENITCYLPSKKGKDALVHGEKGWEVMPVCLTLSPMAARSVDELFKKQPWPGLDGIDAGANLEEPTRLLNYIAKNEGELVGNAAAPSSEFRAIPIRNRDLLQRYLLKLPVAGDA